VRARRTALEAQLKHLEVMVAAGAPLNDDEKALAILVTTRAGTQAIAGASARVRTQRGIRERFRQGLEISKRYDAAFRKVFRDAGLPEDIANLPHVESSFENIARSSAGAVGMWQFTRPAGKRFMTITHSIDERYDPLAAARGAARYLKVAYELLDSWPMAITSYNHGMEGMQRARGRFGTDFEEIVRSYDGRSFGFASKNFYAEFLAAREIARDPAKYFPEGLSFDPPLFLDEVVLASSATPKQISKRYSIPVADLKALNPGWSRKALSHDRAIPAGVSVWLPGGTLESIAAKAAARAAGAATAKKSSGQKAAGAHEARASLQPVASPRASVGSGIADAVTHVVRRGETLFKIATLYGVTLEALLSSNRLTERSVIHPGQQLKVPQLR
jgi:membrane-bound lytic murein transglycosylase D